ncbi:MAG: hypothetical protein HY042_06585, partial [Spirochaetia bacterium]|nr:hypothetical protein [Spirochaetia bacterium]
MRAGRISWMLLLLMTLSTCTSYEVMGIRTTEFSPDETLKHVGIGFFEIQGAGNASRTQRNFYDALAYCLQ